MYQRILFPTDGSKDAETALDHVIPMATAFGAEVVVLEVIESGTAQVHMPVIDSILATEKDQAVVATEEAVASEHLQEVVGRLRNEGIKNVVPSVKVGHVTDAILEAVGEFSCDAIVMATHGRSTIKRFFLGSVAENVIKGAPCAVLLIPSRAGIPMEAPQQATEMVSS